VNGWEWALLFLVLAGGFGALVFWPAPGTRNKVPGAGQDPRPIQRRWEDGPTRPARPVGSMNREDELRYRWGRHAGLVGPRCDDTGEHASTVRLTRIQGTPRPGLLAEAFPGLLAPVCPRCEAPDDQPHYPGCPFFDPDEAALFAGGVLALPPAEARGALDPDAWRPYLTAAEFAETFPGLPYDQADAGPHTGDLAVMPEQLADQLAALDQEVRDYMAQRAIAHVTLRAELLAAWRTALDQLAAI
jgi:hypothetical protein